MKIALFDSTFRDSNTQERKWICDIPLLRYVNMDDDMPINGHLHKKHSRQIICTLLKYGKIPRLDKCT